MSIAGKTLITVAQLQELARRRLPGPVYETLIGGYERGLTVADNVACFDEIAFAPRISNLPLTRSLSTQIMGQHLSMPVICSPTGGHAVHPEGELAVARATAAHDVAMGLSSFASRSIEEVAAINQRTFFQVYWSGSRGDMAWRVDRARSAGAAGLIMTLDWCFPVGRDRGSIGVTTVPQKLMSMEMLAMVGNVLRRPRWLFDFLINGGLPKLVVPNMATANNPKPSFEEAWSVFKSTPAPTWDDVRWLGERWGGPFMVKGIMRVSEARAALEAGATAISVSNHGGMNLDGTPASLRALRPIADAVGDRLEVLMDGGIRRGPDVAKALALGAKAVMLGRPYLFALGASGREGVENVLELMRAGLDYTLYGLGRSSVQELKRSDLHIPAGFERNLDTF